MNKKNQKDVQEHMPSAEEVAQELGKATSIDDFYGGCPKSKAFHPSQIEKIVIQ